MVKKSEVIQELKCYHCGQPCVEDTLFYDERAFCCQGCKTVYEILNTNELCEYYNLNDSPGVRITAEAGDNYHFLEDPEIRKRILTFDSETFARVVFFIPSIHCVSCIWLLENLHKLQPGVLRSEVNFARKTATIDFNPQQLKLSTLAACAESVGYPPVINLEAEEQRVKRSSGNNALVLRLAVAGFCFGNVMLLSFPEYLGIDKSEESLVQLFAYLNIALSVPVVFFSGKEYLASALKSFQQRQVNIDVPIAIGILVLFVRSVAEVVFDLGAGYFDSLTGLVFFLLIGRWFQSKTYESLAFDRDFKAYFPLAVNKWLDESWQPTVIYDLEAGDTIRVRNREIIPTDSELVSETAAIDYSFVTGESRPVHSKKGDTIYAGGRLIGQPVELVVTRSTSQSHLVSLWNRSAFRKEGESRYRNMIDRVAKVFTWTVLVLALVAGSYWMWRDSSQVWLVVTAILMVACPCALALAAPFTYGNMMRVLGRHGFYLKNADILERMATIDSIVFDKTGTVTHGKADEVRLSGELSAFERLYVKALTQASTHPYSVILANSIKGEAPFRIDGFVEIPGKGIEGIIDNRTIRIGSPEFTNYDGHVTDSSSRVFVSIDGECRGYYSIGTSVRSEVGLLALRLNGLFGGLLSGDNESDRSRMQEVFGTDKQLYFNQSPHDKLDYIRSQQEAGRKVMMIGDGLNDAGALQQSDVGVAVSDDSGIFTPACDGILVGEKIGMLDTFLTLSKSARTIVKLGFGISFLYNIVALSFAVSGYLTPLIAAILMPLSSISVVAFSSFAVVIVASKKGL